MDIQAFEKGEIRQYADIASSKLSCQEDVLIVWDGARCGLAGIGYEGAIGSTIAQKKTEHFMDVFFFLKHKMACAKSSLL